MPVWITISFTSIYYSVGLSFEMALQLTEHEVFSSGSFLEASNSYRILKLKI